MADKKDISNIRPIFGEAGMIRAFGRIIKHEAGELLKDAQKTLAQEEMTPHEKANVEAYIELDRKRQEQKIELGLSGDQHSIDYLRNAAQKDYDQMGNWSRLDYVNNQNVVEIKALTAESSAEIKKEIAPLLDEIASLEAEENPDAQTQEDILERKATIYDLENFHEGEWQEYKYRMGVGAELMAKETTSLIDRAGLKARATNLIGEDVLSGETPIDQPGMQKLHFLLSRERKRIDPFIRQAFLGELVETGVLTLAQARGLESGRIVYEGGNTGPKPEGP